MERNSLSSSLRDHSVRDCNNKTIINNNNKMILKDSWSQQSHQSYGLQGGGGGEDYNNISGFSWPPRCYTCSFCKREFRSAQALGGHMNVHRRDRARLRQSPPPPQPQPPHGHGHGHGHFLNLNLNPNPNFSTSSSSPSTIFTTSLPSLVSPPISALSSPSSASPPALAPPPPNPNKWVFDNLHPHIGNNNCNMFVKTCATAADHDHQVSLRLNLEIGHFTHSNEDLDLELRLGYS